MPQALIICLKAKTIAYALFALNNYFHNLSEIITVKFKLKSKYKLKHFFKNYIPGQIQEEILKKNPLKNDCFKKYLRI